MIKTQVSWCAVIGWVGEPADPYHPACSKLKYYPSKDADCSESARSLFSSVHTTLSLSLSLCVCSVPRAAERSCAFCFQLKHRYVASLILHAIIAEITAQLLSLS